VAVGVRSYNSVQGGSASYGWTFDADTEVTGYSKVKLWVSADDADDMDLFVSLRKFDSSGNEVHFRGAIGFGWDVVARGQMRVSLRALDDGLSTPWQPVQKFQGEQKLRSGQIVPVEIAFLPSSTLFRKGESLALSIQGHALVQHPLLIYDRLINKGFHHIHSGGEYDSYLQLPTIPAK
jgi:predicted acyl esterase